MKTVLTFSLLFYMVGAYANKKTDLIYSQITNVALKQDKVLTKLQKLSVELIKILDSEQIKLLEEKNHLIKKISTISKRKENLIKEKRVLFEKHTKLMKEYITTIKENQNQEKK